ncbi:glycoside hydrolase 5 family protein [Arundinibacter roseus]|uniref:mannan endo-1,4-beta-mannosidase n=1 Tax=Arundinibacter roseus TaxID=2070510 RepID=A0A4R4KHX0_9BACT|nr:cellulase family glycosylhydrolase [Arundinibacter roseus]TDB67413.1 hypothetical protein EZE20_05565 [Arundinibacter roseus]
MKKFVNLILLGGIWLIFGSLSRAQSLDNFITRKGDKLYDGDKVFRFIGVNTPNINGHYDGYKNTNPASGYAYDPMELSYEMEGYFKDMAQMGITVFRTWGITVSDGSGNYEAMIEGPQKYNELVLRKMDKMLELCNRYNIRVILCLVKENNYWGGTKAFSALHGGGDYYTSAESKAGFKHFLSALVNRKNQFTGKLYKDDTSILAWEFGNEVPNDKVEWISEMSTFLKKIDPNHMIADPRRANGTTQLTQLVDDVLKRCPHIDLVKTRQYPNYKGTIEELWAVCQGKRPLLLDEFQRMDGFEQVLQQVQNTGTSGGLLWSLMKNQYTGGIGGHVLFHSYGWGGSRWPGFDSGEYFNETKNLMLIREHSYKIQGMKIPPLPAPTDPPILFESSEKSFAALKWRASPGARYYEVERATSKTGPWKNVSGNLDISFDLYFYPMFTDSSANPGETYYYRVNGKNRSGSTSPSNVVGPIKVDRKMMVDDLKDFSKTHSHSPNLTISSETWPRLRQTEEEYYQAERTVSSGSGELVYRADQIKSLEVVAFGDGADSLSFQYSKNGKSWHTAKANKTVRPAYPSEYSGTTNNPVAKCTYLLGSFPAGTSFVKIVTANAGAATTFPWIGRVYLGFTGSIH